MVDLAEIQAAYYMVAATGVLVAAGYYVIILRENRKNGRITLTNTLMQQFSSLEDSKLWIELMNMQWTSYEDFENKYGSDNNEDNYAKRTHIWSWFDSVGYLLEAGIVDRESIFRVQELSASWLWAKFKPIIEENRRRYSGIHYLHGFEYLASEMMRMKNEREPSYRIPETLTKFISDK
jgi:hypothetical protein